MSVRSKTSIVAAVCLSFFCTVGAKAQALGFGAPWVLNDTASADSDHDNDPQIVTDGQGVWIVSWYGSDDFGGTIGTDMDLFYSRSTDNGETWSATAPLNTNAATDLGQDVVPRIVTDGSGTWIAFWNSNENIGGTIGTDSDILYARSINNGETWSAPVVLNSNAGTDSGIDIEPNVATDGQGNWVVIWITDENLGGVLGTDQDLLVSRSSDNGVSWSAPAALADYADTDSADEFTKDIATDGMGNWVVVWSSFQNIGGTLGADDDLLVSRSTDNGATWSSPAVLNSNAETDSVSDFHPKLKTDGLGNWVVVWWSEDSLGGTTGTDSDVLFSRSTDNGMTWSATTALNSNAATDIGPDQLPQIAIDALGNWIAVWTSGEDLGGGIGGDQDILVSYSIDHGASWGAPAVLNSNAGTDSMHDGPPEIATDDIGRGIMVWSSMENLGGTIGTDNDIFISVSSSLPVELGSFTLE